MRPLPVEPVAGVPSFVHGLAVIRGSATPVVDAATLLGAIGSAPTRFVTVKAGPRRVALAVDAVVGIRAIPSESFASLPPLLQDSSVDAISAIATLDAELMLVLRSTRLVPDDAWAALEAEEPA